MNMVHDHIKTIINSSSTDGYLNYYPFDDDLILKAKFNWEQNITVSSNRKFDQLAILNTPVDRDEYD